MAGRISLVGAGPGAPGLITEHGRRLLERADVLVYDAPCAPELLASAPASAERVPVGGWPQATRISQSEINRLLVARARAGLRVVRLKSGDPFMFGRGGEEALAAAQADIDFEIVPGVPAGLAAAALAGVPITQRGLASETVFAFFQSGSPADWEVDLDRLASGRATLVAYLAPEALGPLAQELMRRGRPAATPVVVVESASLAGERVTVSTLCELGARIRGLRAPLVMLVGDAVGLRVQIAWQERRPLKGKAVFFAGPRRVGLEARELLEEMGAEVLLAPAATLQPPPSWEAADAALDELADFDRLVLTSAAAVEAFLGRLIERGRDARALVGLELAAVGPSATAALRAASLLPDLVVSEQDGDYAAPSEIDLHGRRVLLACGVGDEGGGLFERLRREGATVRAVGVFQRVFPALGAGAIEKAAGEGRLAAAVFADSTAVRDFARQLGAGPACALLAGTRIAGLEPAAVRELGRLGLDVAIRPRESTASSLVEALAACFHAGGVTGPAAAAPGSGAADERFT